jgi:metal-responsive CopG/Arc/MetJ family transcriptional regulator
MKVKTSVTLSEDIVEAVDQIANGEESRSEVIERLLRERFVQMRRRARDLRDLEIINRNADRLNEEAEDVLSYQVDT